MGTVFSSSEEEEEELEQEPEMPPFAHSSSPLSPQISMSRSPFFGPSMRNSDPYNAMSPVSLSPTNAHVSSLSRFHNMSTISPGPFLPSWLLSGEEFQTEVYLIRHGEATSNLRAELIVGRAPGTMLTETGKQQARALGIFLRSTGVMFDAVYSSPLERAKQTALAVCQSLSIPEEQLEMLDALQELSQGQWEGRVRSEVYTKDIVQLMNNTQPDFRAPGGESQRQVEFRMVEFLNNIILPHAAIAVQEEAKFGIEKAIIPSGPSMESMESHPLEENVVTSTNGPTSLDPIKIAGRPTPFEPTKTGGRPASLEPIKTVKSDGNGIDSHQHDNDFLVGRDNFSSALMKRGPATIPKRAPYRVAVFSHSLAIKCALRGVLGSDPHRTQHICIDNTSVSVLKHAGSTGWQVQRLNDTTHLRLL